MFSFKRLLLFDIILFNSSIFASYFFILFSCSFFKFSIWFFKSLIILRLSSFSLLFNSYFCFMSSNCFWSSFIFLIESFDELFNFALSSFISFFNLFKSSLNLFCKLSFSRLNASCIDLILSSYSCLNNLVELSELLFNWFIFDSYSFFKSSIFFKYSSSFSLSLFSISSKTFLFEADESIKSFFNLFIILFNCLISLFNASILSSNSLLVLFAVLFASVNFWISSLNLLIISSLFFNSLSPLFCKDSICFFKSIIVVLRLPIFISLDLIVFSNSMIFWDKSLFLFFSNSNCVFRSSISFNIWFFSASDKFAVLLNLSSNSFNLFVKSSTLPSYWYNRFWVLFSSFSFSRKFVLNLFISPFNIVIFFSYSAFICSKAWLIFVLPLLIRASLSASFFS